MKKEYVRQCSPLLREFLLYVETIKGRSSITADEYFLDLRTFFRFIKQQRGLAPTDVDPSEIAVNDVDLALVQTVTAGDILEFMNYAKNERGNINKTRARKTTALRMFFRHLTDYTHQLEVNPTRHLDTPKAKKSLPKYLTFEQSLELLKSADGEYAQRDYCMMVLFLNCGLRRAEMAGINLEDIRPDRTLRVRGKGNKERILYLNDACMDAIAQYLAVRPRDGIAEKDRHALFLSRLKQRITVQGVYYVIKGYLKKIPGAEDFSPHKLRHTAATLMYQQGGVDIRVLKDILGHESLGTTEIYTHLSDKHIRQAVESNPLSDVKLKPRSKPKEQTDEE